ncbi:FAD-binding oxidoreductase [Candidatus Methylomirabilis sp.]|uniref:FAD-binding oxidoreductase n=1 Tax=Candidatus Methylomirabilis sp. TaxID=2032687 RepID=UPI002A61F1A5|nr:FAD-binding oxidoreductase [Candidatus Methylomirabilis sp.]
MNSERLTGRLAEIVGADHIFAAELCAPYAVDGKAPKAVVLPANMQELSEVMKFAFSERVSVVPWGSGTKIGLGGIPARVDLVVGLTRLNQIIDHEPGDLTATFQAGTPLREVQTSLRGSSQFLPFDPARSEQVTIGGILATNASGPWRHRYGTARDLVIGIRVVHADGTVTKGGAKVVKSVSGYDMNKLYVGSLGTLGIILEATLRLYPLPAVERTWVGSFLTGEAAACAMAQILHSTIVCTRIEFLSLFATQSVSRQAGCVFPAGTVTVAVSVGSVPEAVDTQIAAIRKLCHLDGAVTGSLLEGSAQESLWRAICDFPSASDDGRSWVMLKASVLPTKVLKTIHRAEALGRDLGLESAAVSEAGCGIIRLCWRDEAGSQEKGPASIAKGVEELRGWILHDGGSLVILSAPPAIKAGVDVWGPVGNALFLMRELKRSLDPQGLLNPGRFVGGI